MSAHSILIVDDQPLVLTAIARFLEQKGYIVHTASNGKEGLAKAESIAIDLIITDVMMPIMDGWDFVRALRANPSLTLIPVIILSDQDSAESRMQGFRLGADDYVAKTTIVDELEVRIARALERTAIIHQALGMTSSTPPEPAATGSAPAGQRKIAQLFEPAATPPTRDAGRGASSLNLPPLIQAVSRKAGKAADPSATEPGEVEGASAEGTPGMRGTLDQIGLASLITLLSTSGKSGILTLNRANEDGCGRIFMREGQVLKIRIDGNPDVQNIDAFTAIMRWENATFAFSLQDVTAHDEIQVPIEHLLMEASRIFDEEAS